MADGLRSNDQRAYWADNLDPTNLGAAVVDARQILRSEGDFYLVPDREFFLQTLRQHGAAMVVELGAGLSYQVVALARLGYRVVACDIALTRLRTLRRAARELLSSEEFARIDFVACAAEALPFRSSSVEILSTRAVLIHTHLSVALDEIARVLRPAGCGVFSEPLTRHPLVNLYRRTFAPPEWRTMARYIGDLELEEIRRRFRVVQERYDYLIGFLAFLWQYAVRVPALFWATLRLADLFDSALFRLNPRLRRFAWFVTVVCEKPR